MSTTEAPIAVITPLWLRRYWDGQAVLSTSLNTLALYLVLFQTPKEMRAYKFFLLNILGWTFLVDFLVTVWDRPVGLFPLAGGYADGPFREHCDINWYLSIFVLFCVCNCQLALVCGFLYRWWALVPDIWVMQDRRRTIGVCASIHLFLSTPQSILVMFARTPSDIQDTYVRQHYPSIDLSALKCYALYEPEINGFLVYIMLAFTVGISITLGMGGFAFVKVVVILRRVKGHFSKQTYKLHRQLMLALIAQAAVPVVIYIGPICVAIAGYNLVSKNIQGLSYILLAIFSLHSTINAVLMILLISPYREAILRLTVGQPIFGKYQWTSSAQATEPSVSAVSSNPLLARSVNLQ